jgi:ribosome recycling factor
MGEASRTKIRNLRRRAHDVCKKGQAGKLDHISKDDAFRVSKEVEATTEEMIQRMDTVVDAKQASVVTL